MKFFETSKYYTLKKSIYINLRWIGVIGQLISVCFVYFFFNCFHDPPQTLAQIGEDLQLSRERVRQIETRALLKLRQPQRRSKVRDYIQGLDS